MKKKTPKKKQRRLVGLRPVPKSQQLWCTVTLTSKLHKVHNIVMPFLSIPVRGEEVYIPRVDANLDVGFFEGKPIAFVVMNRGYAAIMRANAVVPVLVLTLIHDKDEKAFEDIVKYLKEKGLEGLGA